VAISVTCLINFYELADREAIDEVDDVWDDNYSDAAVIGTSSRQTLRMVSVGWNPPSVESVLKVRLSSCFYSSRS